MECNVIRWQSYRRHWVAPKQVSADSFQYGGDFVTRFMRFRQQIEGGDDENRG